VMLAVAVVALIASQWGSLPALLPSHWDISGRPDQFWERGWWMGFTAVMAVVPVALAASVHIRRRPKLNRAAASALATLMATLAFAQLLQTLAYVRGDQSMAPTFVGLALALVLPFTMFVTLSRVGRAAEQRRDLGDPMKKERA
jgi:hypothetical protein